MLLLSAFDIVNSPIFKFCRQQPSTSDFEKELIIAITSISLANGPLDFESVMHTDKDEI